MAIVYNILSQNHHCHYRFNGTLVLLWDCSYSYYFHLNGAPINTDLTASTAHRFTRKTSIALTASTAPRSSLGISPTLALAASMVFRSSHKTTTTSTTSTIP
ncbi:hypothetical protein ACLOJK_007397 [Asimina triloba]